jgi:hypothetical protein
MKSWVELTVWVSTEEPVTLGDIDRLTETLLVYLEAIGGIPRIDHYVRDDTVCITASANPGTPNGQMVDKLYTRSSILKALNAAGMEVPKEEQ